MASPDQSAGIYSMYITRGFLNEIMWDSSATEGGILNYKEGIPQLQRGESSVTKWGFLSYKEWIPELQKGDSSAAEGDSSATKKGFLSYRGRIPQLLRGES